MDGGAADSIYNLNSLSVTTLRLRGRTLVMLVTVLAMDVSLPAGAQGLPSDPIAFDGGRVTVGGDVAATFSCSNAASSTSRVCRDDTGFFNYSDYHHSTLRMLLVDVAAAVKATDRFSILGE